jgi:hypothetical protein
MLALTTTDIFVLGPARLVTVFFCPTTSGLMQLLTLAFLGAWVNCCCVSLAQSFLVLGPMELLESCTYSTSLAVLVGQLVRESAAGLASTVGALYNFGTDHIDITLPRVPLLLC